MVKELKKPELPGTSKQFAIFAAIVIAIGFLSYSGLRDTHQTLAATICVALVVGTLMFWRFRVALAFIAIVILLVTGTMDLEHAIEFMNLDVHRFPDRHGSNSCASPGHWLLPLAGHKNNQAC